MYKLYLYATLLISQNKKKVISTYFIIFTIFCLVMFSIGFLNRQEVEQSLPKNMLYLQTTGANEELILDALKADSVSYKPTIPLRVADDYLQINNPYSSTTNILLTELNYSDQVSISQVEANQEQVNVGNPVVNEGILYNFNSDLINTPGVSLINDYYHIDSLLVGSYPITDDQVLIGENYANFLLAENDLTTYQDLLGQEVLIETEDCLDNVFCINDNYQISGVYKSSNGSEENLIINPSAELLSEYEEQISAVSPAYFATFSSKEAMDSFIENNEISYYLTSQSLSHINLVLLIKIILLILLNVVFYILLREEFYLIYFYTRFYGVRIGTITLICLLPFIILNGLFLVYILLGS